jgi:6-pyruvoyltetrahydropterin/6-carboxytetrahydropterin synthase
MKAPSVRVTKRYRFAASHRLHAPAFSDEQNRAMFGKCNNPHGHGHNYQLEIAVRGEVDPASGRAIDPERLDGLVREHVIRVLDHSNMNEKVPEFKSMVPTTENLAILIERWLKQSWDAAFGTGPVLEYVRVQETKNNTFQTADR